MGVVTDWMQGQKPEQPARWVKRGNGDGEEASVAISSLTAEGRVLFVLCPRRLLETQSFSLISGLGLWSEASSIGSAGDREGPLEEDRPSLHQTQQHFHHFVGIGRWRRKRGGQKGLPGWGSSAGSR